MGAKLMRLEARRLLDAMRSTSRKTTSKTTTEKFEDLRKK
jgi:hypothetical protein